MQQQDSCCCNCNKSSSLSRTGKSPLPVHHFLIGGKFICKGYPGSPENSLLPSSREKKSKGLCLSRLEICVSVIYPFNKFTAIHSGKLISGTLLPVFIQVFLKRNYELPCWPCGRNGGKRQIRFFSYFLLLSIEQPGGGAYHQ